MANPQVQSIHIVTTQPFDGGYPFPKLQAIHIVTTQPFDGGYPFPKLQAIHIISEDLKTKILAGTYKQMTINS